MRFAIFPLHLSKLLRAPRRSDTRSYEVLHQSRKNISAKCNPSKENQPPDPLTSLMNMSLVLRLPRKMHLCRSAIVFRNSTKFHVLFTFDKVHNPLRLPRETTSERPKVFRTPPSVFCLYFDFKMCFAPQRRALFRHLNF